MTYAQGAIYTRLSPIVVLRHSKKIFPLVRTNHQVAQHYDLLIRENVRDIERLEGTGLRGFCICSDNYEYAQEVSRKLSSKNISCYTRIDLPYTQKLDQSAITRLRKYDVVCITIDSPQTIPSAVKLGADMLRIDMRIVKYLKKRTAGLIKEKGLFVEVVLGECRGENSVLWLNALRRLIKLRFTSKLVFSSGASEESGVKSFRDIVKMLVAFGLKERTADKIVRNARRVLSIAALKRYSHKMAIVNSLEEGRLKRDFVLSLFQGEEQQV